MFAHRPGYCIVKQPIHGVIDPRNANYSPTHQLVLFNNYADNIGTPAQHDGKHSYRQVEIVSSNPATPELGISLDLCKLIVANGGDVSEYPLLFTVTGTPKDSVPDTLYEHEYAAYDDAGNKTGVTRHTRESWANNGTIFVSNDKKTMVIPCDAHSGETYPTVSQILATKLTVIPLYEWEKLRATPAWAPPEPTV